MDTVSILKTSGEMVENVSALLAPLGGLSAFAGSQDRVLIKPNLNDTGLVTSIDLTDALITLLKENGVSRIAMGEATFGAAQMTDALFRKSGYAEMAERHGIPLYNFNRSQAVTVPVIAPLITDTLHIAEEALEADVIINLPVMKVHYATDITLAMKNLKGLLVGDEKPRFHDIGLNEAIVDLNRTIRPALNIVDAITCMERMGPKGGDLLRLDLLLAGDSAAHVDSVGARIMGYDPHEIKHLTLYAEKEGVDIDAVDTVGEDIKSVAYPFKKVDLTNAIPSHIDVHAKGACSACMNDLILSCSFLEGDADTPVDLYMGSGWGTIPPDAVAFGNCAAKSGAARSVRGCPPFPFALKKLLDI